MMKEDSNRTAYQEGMVGSQHHDAQELQRSVSVVRSEVSVCGEVMTGTCILLCRKIFELDQLVRQKDMESEKKLLKMEAGEREVCGGCVWRGGAIVMLPCTLVACRV